MSGTPTGSLRHPDRVASDRWLTVALVVSAALALGIAGQTAARGHLTPFMGFAAGAAVAVLALLGLPSVSLRALSRMVLFVSALTLIRFGILSGSIAGGGQRLLAWLVAGVCVLVLSDLVGSRASAPLDAPTTFGAGAGAPPPAGARPGAAARTTAIVAGVIVLIAVILAPLLLPYVGKPSQPGKGATLGSQQQGGTALRSTDSLDMTRRPELTDEVVFTVDTDRATFWRGETFDQWDGRSWTRSDQRFGPMRTGTTPNLGADDLGARGSDVVKQRFRMEAGYTDIIYAAPTAVEVQVESPVRQRADGTLLTAPLGQGATYTVTSRRTPLTDDRLRAATGTIPATVADQYAQAPTTTDRVRQVATEITAGAATQYDKVLAIEAWMGDRVAYSLDAPLAPQGVDVVDHFLFDAEEGWCEQIASSLVVLARANGIPARLVTGFVPDDRDPLTGVFTVRARDAHAWAEVWFPEVGWVPFDPTADVPLAGADKSQPTMVQWLLDHLVVLGLVVAVVVLLVGPVRAVVRRRRGSRPARGEAWAVGAERRLDALGKKVDRPRRVDETAGAYAVALAQRYREPRLAAVGAVVDQALYATDLPSAAEQADAGAVLDLVREAPVPEQEPHPVLSG